MRNYFTHKKCTMAYNMTYNRCPQVIKGVTLCLAHTIYQTLSGVHAIYTFAFSHPPHQASHLSILSLRPHSLIQFLTTSWGHFTNTPVAARQPQAFSHTACFKHHTTSLRNFLHICCRVVVTSTRCFAFMHTIGILYA